MHELRERKTHTSSIENRRDKGSKTIPEHVVDWPWQQHELQLDCTCRVLREVDLLAACVEDASEDRDREVPSDHLLEDTSIHREDLLTSMVGQREQTDLVDLPTAINYHVIDMEASEYMKEQKVS